MVPGPLQLEVASGSAAWSEHGDLPHRAEHLIGRFDFVE